ncbi:MAG: penicillin-binding protein 2 [Planctomycetes bacterium]|nr:penicillin-binding protein 2 [Planctomycetota bacterium]
MHEEPAPLPAHDTPPAPPSLAAAAEACCQHARDGAPDRGARIRSGLVIIPLVVAYGILVGRSIQIHVDDAEEWSAMAERQRVSRQRQPAPRGSIFGADGTALVASMPCFTVFADLKTLRDKDEAAEKLAPLLDLERAALRKRLDREGPRVVTLARHVEHDTGEAIRKLKLRGIGMDEEFHREYPLEELACHVIGWANVDGGRDGVELRFDALLRGVPGFQTVERDAARRPLALSDDNIYLAGSAEPRSGLKMTLTLHPGIQHAAEEELDKIMEKFKARGATCVVLDCETGAVVALACRPAYNLNEPSKVTDEQRRKRAVSDCYEPGSTFKTFIAAMALEKKLARRNEMFFCENGAWRLGYRTLHDAHAYGSLSFDDVIIHSSNIGAAKIGLRLGRDGVWETVKAFGFGERTRIDLPGEAKGIVRPLEKWTKDSLLSIPMGQEIAVTPLQLATAYAAMLNGGMLLRPQLVAKIEDRNGETLFQLQPEPVRRVLSPATSKAMREILSQVVGEGTGKSAQCEEYDIGGKTGTAQKVIDGLYSHEKYVGSFCGFAPVDRPRLVCLVAVDEPLKSLGYYGGTVGAPAVKEVLRRGLLAMGVPPKAKKQAPDAAHNSN